MNDIKKNKKLALKSGKTRKHDASSGKVNKGSRTLWIVLLISMIFISIVISSSLIFDLGGGHRGSDTKKYNLIVIVFDAMRYDHLGCYGYSKGTSPNIDALCKESVVFDNAIAQCAATRCSTTSLFTSTYYNAHGVDNPWSVKFSKFKKNYTFNESFPENYITLAEILSSNGIYTYMISENSLANITKGFNKTYLYDENSTISKFDANIESTRKVIDEIRDNKDRQFFIYAHYVTTHLPFIAPDSYSAEFRNSNYSGIFNFKNYTQQDILSRKDLSAGEVAELRADYDGEVLVSDDIVGSIRNALGRYNLTGNTAIVLIADHGEELDEKDYFDHPGLAHGRITNRVIQIPLIFFIPGKRAERIGSMVESIDISPSILKLMGISVPGQFSGSDLLGKSHEYAFSSDKFGNVGVRTEEYLFILNDDKYLKVATSLGFNVSKTELYDLRNDPFELHAIRDAVKEKEFTSAAQDYLDKDYVR